MTFHDRQLSSMSFQAWIMKFLNLMTPYEPCTGNTENGRKKRVFTIPLGGCN